MSNDNFNQNRDYTNRFDNVQKQQMGPGGFVPPPPPNRGGQFPGMENQPRTAPPDFTPEPPRMDRRQMGESNEQTGFGAFMGPGRPGRPGRPGVGGDIRREMRRCLYRFTYIWLINGNDFWFYPISVDNQFVIGFRWRRNRWEFDRINLRRIAFFRCF